MKVCLECINTPEYDPGSGEGDPRHTECGCGSYESDPRHTEHDPGSSGGNPRHSACDTQ